MKEGTASHTARSVAARRLEYDRVAAGYGDPAADEALSRDVADGLTPRAHPDARVPQGADRVLRPGGGGRPRPRDHPGRDRRRRLRRPRLPVRAARCPLVRGRPPRHPGRQAGARGPARARRGAHRVHPRRLHRRPGSRPAARRRPRPGQPRRSSSSKGSPSTWTGRSSNGYSPSSARSRRPAAALAISVSTGTATSATRARFQARVAELGEPARTVLTAGGGRRPARRRRLGDTRRRATGSGPRACCSPAPRPPAQPQNGCVVLRTVPRPQPGPGITHGGGLRPSANTAGRGVGVTRPWVQQ